MTDLGGVTLLSVLVSILNRMHERVRPGRQGELKHAASRFIGLCPQLASVRIDDGPADRQPHPHSAGFRGVKRLKNALEMLRIDTGARIAHYHEEAVHPIWLGADQQLP
jgi:hypothetical protein